MVVQNSLTLQEKQLTLTNYSATAKQTMQLRSIFYEIIAQRAFFRTPSKK